MYRKILIVSFFTFAFMLIVLPSESHNNNDVHPSVSNLSGDKCVEPTQLMREKHHIFIKDHSHETVVNGIRTKKHSLKNCIQCHIQPLADGTFPTKDDEKHFCAGCHLFTGVKVECFDCHASKPLRKVKN
ncbi:MAG: sulfur reduction protein DsrJ [Gammaproteobacteria bacterium]|nr:sulfur reduction protein DsrJ [Gammaproteobacteria bacterium]|tara:strand:+ start:1183 stop:1572 length:390 start_codon:yes stop_codon:yes gene_type:complete